MKINLKMVVFFSVMSMLFYTSTASAGKLKNRVIALEAIVTALQAQIADLQSRLDTVETNTALQMDGHVRVDSNTINGAPGPHVIFQGVNVHIQNGEGRTRSSGSGLGNLIVGYNEEPSTFEPGDRGGSHNLILGRNHKYLAAGGIANGWGAELRANASAALAADENIIDRSYSASIGGWGNYIIGRGVTIGGKDNTIYGNRSVIVGGQNNTTGEIDTSLGLYTTIVGGSEHIATGDYSSISGGWRHTTSGDYGAAFGGDTAMVSGDNAVVVGGAENIAEATLTTVMGGSSNIANDNGWSTIVGGSGNIATGSHATIAGGSANQANGRSATVSGGYDNHAVGNYSSISAGVSSWTYGTYSAFSGGSSDVRIDDDYGWGAGDLRYSPPDP